MLDKPRAFTLESEGILASLITDILIAPTYSQQNNAYIPRLRRGLWDTGASRSTISQRVVDDLHLVPAGQCTISTANGAATVNTYLVDIALPNQVTVKDVLVSCANIGNDNDALIGMDIICVGDFSITNVGGKTKFSFRIPSMEEIDYVKDIKSQNNKM